MLYLNLVCWNCYKTYHTYFDLPHTKANHRLYMGWFINKMIIPVFLWDYECGNGARHHWERIQKQSQLYLFIQQMLTNFMLYVRHCTTCSEYKYLLWPHGVYNIMSTVLSSFCFPGKFPRKQCGHQSIPKQRIYTIKLLTHCQHSRWKDSFTCFGSKNLSDKPARASLLCKLNRKLKELWMTYL